MANTTCSSRDSAQGVPGRAGGVDLAVHVLCSFPDRHADYLVPETPGSTCWFFLPPGACVVGGIGRHSPGLFALSRNFWEALRNEGVPERGHPALRCSTFRLIVFDTVFLMAEGWATNINPRNSLNPGRITYSDRT
jgi:hypothetical protein